MKKDAFYFSHDSNAKDDPKCMMLIEHLGLEGYGIFWVLVETLRDQPNYKYPLALLPALARRYNTTFEKVKAVVFAYELFQIEDEKFFFSNSLNERMRLANYSRVSGIKGSLIRYGYLTKEESLQLTDTEIIEYNEKVKNKEVSTLSTPLCSTRDSGVVSTLIAKKERKEKEKKGKERKIKDFDLTFVENLDLNGSTDKFKEILTDWLEYKKEIKNSYKSQKSVETFFNQLLKLSNSDFQTAREIVNYSIGNNYKGIFEPKKNTQQNKFEQKSHSVNADDYKKKALDPDRNKF